MKRNMLYGAMLALSALLTSACVSQPTKPLTIHQRYEVACVASGASFSAITAINELKPLKASQQKLAAEAYAKTGKRCKLAPGEDYPYTATEAVMSELEGSAAVLKRIEGEVK